jgi:hypothetical protein
LIRRPNVRRRGGEPRNGDARAPRLRAGPAAVAWSEMTSPSHAETSGSRRRRPRGFRVRDGSSRSASSRSGGGACGGRRASEFNSFASHFPNHGNREFLAAQQQFRELIALLDGREDVQPGAVSPPKRSTVSSRCSAPPGALVGPSLPTPIGPCSPFASPCRARPNPAMARCSGHADWAALVRQANALNPEIVVPIHTQARHVMGSLVPNVQLLADGDCREV